MEKITYQPEWDALHKFDAENNVEPPRVTAERIVSLHCSDPLVVEPLVDAVSNAIEDAILIGNQRRPLVPVMADADVGFTAEECRPGGLITYSPPYEAELRYATRLAQYLHETHWKAAAPDWRPLPDLMGVLTQIDNMIANLKVPRQC